MMWNVWYFEAGRVRPLVGTFVCAAEVCPFRYTSDKSYQLLSMDYVDIRRCW